MSCNGIHYTSLRLHTSVYTPWEQSLFIFGSCIMWSWCKFLFPFQMHILFKRISLSFPSWSEMLIRIAEWVFRKGLSSFLTRTLQWDFSLKCWWKRSQSSSHSSVEVKLEKGTRPAIRPFLSSVWWHGLRHFKCPLVFLLLQALPSHCVKPSQEHVGLAGGKWSCPFLTLSSAERTLPQIASFTWQPRMTLTILRAILWLWLTHLRKPAVDSQGTVYFV